MTAIHHWAHVGLAILLAAFKDKLKIDPANLHFINVLQGLSMVLVEFPSLRTKVQGLLGAATKAVGCLVLVLLMNGCALTPGEIQTGTTLGLTSMLTMAVIAEKDPAVQQRIKTDCRVIAVTTQGFIPQLWPGATAQQFAGHTVDTCLTLLKSKLASSPNGPMIVELIQAAEVPFAAVLSNKASPTAAMSTTAQADALAFFNSVCTSIATFLGDPTLMPPVPPPVIAPAPTAAPAPPTVPK